MTTKPGLINAEPFKQCPLDHTAYHKLRHDLSGPIINIKGFTAEINLTLTTLQDLLSENREQVPNHFYSEMEQLIVRDLIPCFNYINSSNESLRKRVANIIPEHEQSTEQNQ